jgi:hypothetical protein
VIPKLYLPLAASCESAYQLGIKPQWTDALGVVHVFLSTIDGVHTVSWEGTTDPQEWLVDFLAFRNPFNSPAYGPTHFGLTQTMLSVADAIEAYLASLGFPPYYNAGHSKGGGEAILFHAEMKRRGHPPLATRVFEPPQVGGTVLRDYFADQDFGWTCTVNAHGRDMVTQVPLLFNSWCHESDPLLLTVPDDYSALTKHLMPAILAALAPGTS